MSEMNYSYKVFWSSPIHHDLFKRDKKMKEMLAVIYAFLRSLFERNWVITGSTIMLDYPLVRAVYNAW